MRAWRGLVSTSAGLEATPFQSLFGTDGRISRFTFLPVSTPSCARPAIFPVPAVSLGFGGVGVNVSQVEKDENARRCELSLDRRSVGSLLSHR